MRPSTGLVATALAGDGARHRHAGRADPGGVGCRGEDLERPAPVDQGDPRSRCADRTRRPRGSRAASPDACGPVDRRGRARPCPRRPPPRVAPTGVPPTSFGRRGLHRAPVPSAGSTDGVDGDHIGHCRIGHHETATNWVEGDTTDLGDIEIGAFIGPHLFVFAGRDGRHRFRHGGREDDRAAAHQRGRHHEWNKASNWSTTGICPHSTPPIWKSRVQDTLGFSKAVVHQLAERGE